MITSVLVNFFGALSFLFFFWRRLREDYPANQIFSTAFFVLGGILLGWLFAGRFSPAWWFWAEVVGATLGFTLGVLHFKFRFHESLEALTTAFLSWIAVLFLKDASLNASFISLSGFLVCLILIGMFYLLDIYYKKFTWYRSGRVGFAGLAVTGLFFLVRAAVGVFFPFVLTFSGKFDAIISGIVAFVFFLLIYNLSKSES